MLGKISTTDSFPEGLEAAILVVAVNVVSQQLLKRSVRESQCSGLILHTHPPQTLSHAAGGGITAGGRGASMQRGILPITDGSRSCFIQGLDDRLAWFMCMKTVFTPAKFGLSHDVFGNTTTLFFRSSQYSRSFFIPHSMECTSLQPHQFTCSYIFIAARGPTVATLVIKEIKHLI